MSIRVKRCRRCAKSFEVFSFGTHECIVRYPPDVQQKLERLWFIYGNNGPKCTMDNHKFIQRHIEGKSHEAKFYNPTNECKQAVAAILKP